MRPVASGSSNAKSRNSRPHRSANNSKLIRQKTTSDLRTSNGTSRLKPQTRGQTTSSRKQQTRLPKSSSRSKSVSSHRLKGASGRVNNPLPAPLKPNAAKPMPVKRIRLPPPSPAARRHEKTALETRAEPGAKRRSIISSSSSPPSNSSRGQLGSKDLDIIRKTVRETSGKPENVIEIYWEDAARKMGIKTVYNERKKSYDSSREIALKGIQKALGIARRSQDKDLMASLERRNISLGGLPTASSGNRSRTGTEARSSKPPSTGRDYPRQHPSRDQHARTKPSRKMTEKEIIRDFIKPAVAETTGANTAKIIKVWRTVAKNLGVKGFPNRSPQMVAKSAAHRAISKAMSIVQPFYDKFGSVQAKKLMEDLRVLYDKLFTKALLS